MYPAYKDSDDAPTLPGGGDAENFAKVAKYLGDAKLAVVQAQTVLENLPISVQVVQLIHTRNMQMLNTIDTVLVEILKHRDTL